MNEKNIKEQKFFIKGMHCRSCELLIEENLKEIEHVKSVDIDYKTGEAIVHYDGHAPDIQLINKAIAEAGYEVGRQDRLPLLTRDKREYINLGIAFLFLMILYLVLKSLGLTDISLSPNLVSPSWGLILLIGLVAGFSTCMALVGGLSLGLSAKFAESHPTATAKEKFRPHIFFVVGRILSYALLGGVLGVLGTAFRLSPTINGILVLLVGIVMLIMGLQLINIFPRLSRFKLTLPKSIGKVLGLNQKHKEYSHKHAMIMGALTFFLPCGFTQAMQLYAISTGNFGSGALIMGLFALGTVPGLLSIGGITSLVRGSFKERFFKVAGLAVIFFALLNLNNGYTLASLSIDSFRDNNSNQEKIVNDPNVTLENGVQVVRMTENNNGYSPNKFSIQKGVPVKWVIDARAPYSCASTILLPKLNIQKSLVAGENTIEFTPEESGSLPFSCSMGMYTGVFNVYEGEVSANNNTATNENTNTALAASSNSGTCSVSGSGGSCGCGGGTSIKNNPTDTSATESNDVQLIKTTYTKSQDIQPNSFTVKVGKPVRFEVLAKDDGSGCMSTIKVPGLYDRTQLLLAGETIVMEFTPTKTGDYPITCAMGVSRGVIKVQ